MQNHRESQTQKILLIRGFALRLSGRKTLCKEKMHVNVEGENGHPSPNLLRGPVS